MSAVNSAPTPSLTPAPADRLEPNGVALTQTPAEPFVSTRRRTAKPAQTTGMKYRLGLLSGGDRRVV
jgi:hypothetical protein